MRKTAKELIDEEPFRWSEDVDQVQQWQLLKQAVLDRLFVLSNRMSEHLWLSPIFAAPAAAALLWREQFSLLSVWVVLLLVWDAAHIFRTRRMMNRMFRI